MLAFLLLLLLPGALAAPCSGDINVVAWEDPVNITACGDIVVNGDVVLSKSVFEVHGGRIVGDGTLTVRAEKIFIADAEILVPLKLEGDVVLSNTSVAVTGQYCIEVNGGSLMLDNVSFSGCAVDFLLNGDSVSTRGGKYTGVVNGARIDVEGTVREIVKECEEKVVEVVPQNVLDEINTLRSALEQCSEEKQACAEKEEKCVEVEQGMNPLVLLVVGVAVGYLLGRM